MQLELSKVRSDGETQSRVELSQETVAEYAQAMESGASFPAIVVFHDGSHHWLADGFHRLFAARKAGLVAVDADVRAGTKEDALWFALGANESHGLRRSSGDVRRAVELALRHFPGKTQQAIAEHVRCTQGYVAKTKDQLIPRNKLPDAPAMTVGKDGKMRPTKYTKAPKMEGEEKPSRKSNVQVGSAVKGHAALSQQDIERSQRQRDHALTCGRSAISKLQEISTDNPARKEALDQVIQWINFNK